MQVFQVWKTSRLPAFIIDLNVLVSFSCCIKFIHFSQTKTLQTHSNLFDLKTLNII
ncbi:hypothetical protein Bca4012_093292 [Brassica carinata]